MKQKHTRLVITSMETRKILLICETTEEYVYSNCCPDSIVSLAIPDINNILHHKYEKWISSF